MVSRSPLGLTTTDCKLRKFRYSPFGSSASTLIWASPLSTETDRKSTRLNSSQSQISYAVFCLKKESDAGAPHLAREDRDPRQRATPPGESPPRRRGDRHARSRLGRQRYLPLPAGHHRGILRHW